MPLYTYLVKSQKYHKYCLACVSEEGKWIRPIKYDNGFSDEDITMDNAKPIDVFDVVDMEFGAPHPIKHHVENMTFVKGCKLSFVKKLCDSEKRRLLSRLTNPELLKNIKTKDELYAAIIDLGKSLVLVGPVSTFEIIYQKDQSDRPRLMIPVKNDYKAALPCTDPKFCEYVINNIEEFEEGYFYYHATSNELLEFKDKKIYLVIGLTGDHLVENGEIISGAYAPKGRDIAPHYWPMVVSILVVPEETRRQEET